MRISRFATIYRQELAQTLRRPMLWILAGVLLFVAYCFSIGKISIHTGDASVGGTKAWVTSEFAVSHLLALLVALLYSFFIAILAGMSVIHDDDLKVGEILHATPLKVSEYVWGKFLAILTAFAAILALQLLMTMFLNHVPPSPRADEIRGPFDAINYLRPVLAFAAPFLLFLAGTAFYLGERSRRPITVFLLPLAVFLLLGFFLWTWSPTWLAPEVNRILMLIDPSGFRWLDETWLKLDLGAKYYNLHRVGLDTGFVATRAAYSLLGILAVFLAQRHLAARLRGEKVRPTARSKGAAGPAAAPAAAPARPLGALAMSARPPGLWQGALVVARTELRNLLFQPGVYLFIVIILVFTLGDTVIALGPFDAIVLLTPGQVATACMGSLAAMVCLLLLFYTVESLERDRSTGLAAIAYATPVESASLLFGKSLANSLIGVLAMLAAFVAGAIAILIQGKVALSLTPFLLVWGLLLVPTFVVWTAFITAIQAMLAERYLTYGVGLGTMALMLYLSDQDKLNWLNNWGLWTGAVRWSDRGAFEIDAQAIFLSRLLALGLSAFFIAFSVRAFARQEADAIGVWNRIQPGHLGRSFFRFAPFLVVPVVAGIWLYLEISNGFAGDKVKKKEKDYWIQNLATWKDAPQPALVGVDLDLKIDPREHHLHSRGRFDLANDRAAPLARFALTGSAHWRKVSWTLDGKAYKPQERSGLYVFAPTPPLPPGGRLAVGFDFENTVPEGISKNGGGVKEFILPSGVVLTCFSLSMVPDVGYDEGIGVDPRENRYEPKVYSPPDFYQAKLDPAYTSPSRFTTRIRIDGPADFTFNSVGARVEETVAKGRRIVVWQSDYPVRLFNIVGGRWQVKQRDDTRVFYFPEHPYNIEEISEAAAAARRYYSEWFYPYPWRELKISEFPAHANYAQGFPTDISFSEGIGFLTGSSNKTRLAFAVTAHESAHQWWGNILTPGDGPGGNILSEGMSHFSTLLLLEQVKGLPARIEFAKRIEESYDRRRRVDAERPLVEIDGSKEGDKTVTYDKGGWVPWMMLNLVGRERTLAGLKQFIAEYKDGPDYPVLQDFLAVMRRYAPDPPAFDAFARQWYHQVVVPRYRLSATKRQPNPAVASWEVEVKVRNEGTGRMPLEVAATSGVDRFTEDGKPGKSYRDVRATVTLGAGEERRVTLKTPFEPKLVLVDPDAKVLQLRRKSAVVKL